MIAVEIRLSMTIPLRTRVADAFNLASVLLLLESNDKSCFSLSNKKLTNTIHYIHIKNDIQFGRYIVCILRDIVKSILANHQPQYDAT